VVLSHANWLAGRQHGDGPGAACGVHLWTSADVGQRGLCAAYGGTGPSGVGRRPVACLLAAWSAAGGDVCRTEPAPADHQSRRAGLVVAGAEAADRTAQLYGVFGCDGATRHRYIELRELLGV